MQITRRAVALAAALALGTAACGGDDEDPSTAERRAPAPGPEAPTQILGGTTTLRLDENVIRTLDVAAVEITPLQGARLRDDRLVFPIVTGDLDIDTPSGRLQHDGGVRFSAGGERVEARGLLLDPGREVITARVNGERITLLSLDLGRPRVIETSDLIVVPGSGATLGDQVVDALNTRLGVDALAGGLRIGEVSVRARRP